MDDTNSKQEILKMNEAIGNLHCPFCHGAFEDEVESNISEIDTHKFMIDFKCLVCERNWSSYYESFKE